MKAKNPILDDTSAPRGQKILDSYIHELAVHTICHSSMARDAVSEVLDVEGPLQTAGEEATEGRNKRRESCEDEHVELDGSNDIRL